TRFSRDWSSDVCSSDLSTLPPSLRGREVAVAIHDAQEPPPGMDCAPPPRKDDIRPASGQMTQRSPYVNVTQCCREGRATPDSTRSEERRVGKGGGCVGR